MGRIIIEPFHTVREAAKHAGLELSIGYGIIKQHNAAITANSKP